MGFENGYKEIYFPKEEGMALADYKNGDNIHCKAVPIKQLHYNSTNGYGAYLCEEVYEDGVTEQPGSFSIAGTFLTELSLGQTYDIFGSIIVYRDKKQIKVKELQKVMPSNKRGIISFMKSLNDMQFYPEIIYAHFGDKSLQVLRDTPEKILEVCPALWEERVYGWQKQLEEVKDDHYIVAKLMGYGLKGVQIKQLFDKFGSGVLTKIERNPYFLSSEVRNYSFKKCDSIAKIMGFPLNDRSRIVEGLFFVLNEAKYGGHTYLPKNVLFDGAKKELSLKIGIREARKLYKKSENTDFAIYKHAEMSFKISTEELYQSISAYEQGASRRDKEDSKICLFEPTDKMLEEALNELDISKRVYIKDNKIFSYYSYLQESSISYNIKRLIKSSEPIKSNLESFLEQYTAANQITLEARQKEAILKICSTSGGVYVLNGSAGCGKTFCLGIVIKMLNMLYKKSGKTFWSGIAAPTGKAAQVAARATGLQATTVHKLLKYSPDEGYAYNSSNPLFFDLLVIDESSMLDVELASALVEALADGTKLVFVGDTKQLPSVNAGNVLRDIIASGNVPMTTLNVVKRQGKDSGIIKNANKIINGEMISSEKETGDAYVYKATDVENCLDKMISLVELSLKRGVSLDNIQVLCPQKTGIIGTAYLNYVIQQRFNGETCRNRVLNKQISIQGYDDIDLYFQIGDKVIHTKNNYNLQWYGIADRKLVQIQGAGVANGECGTIIDIREKDDNIGVKIYTIYVKYDEKIIRYEGDFSELDHAYALTIHKSQGSQWDTVIMPIMRVNYMMLDRELFYTGYTRAQKMSLVVGEPEAMKYAVGNIRSNKRFTGLNDFLKQI